MAVPTNIKFVNYERKVNRNTSILVAKCSYVKYDSESALHFDVTLLVFQGEP